MIRVSAALLLLTASIAAQGPFRSGVNLVRVDVLVTDRDGAPVTNLTKDDFEIQEDGRLQTIDQFRLVQVSGNADPRSPLTETIRPGDDESMLGDRDDVRVFAIFLDDYHIKGSTWKEVHDQLIAFVRTQLRPNDFVAVMNPSMSVKTLLFTRDHESILDEIREFEPRMCDPRIHGAGCQGAYLPARTVFEKEYAHLGRGVVERIRTEVTISALQGLAVRLGALRQGRKAIILVTEGLAISPSSMLLRDVWRDANRHNTSIYPLGPRGLTPARPGRTSLETLRLLAEQTGGRAVVNTNDLAEGLAAVVRDASTYYLLGYSSTTAQNDGKFHDVKVRVGRRDVTVHARKGYWAMTAADAERAASPTVSIVTPAQRALSALAAADANTYVYRWVGAERGAEGRMRVTVVWEPKSNANRRPSQKAGRVGLKVENEEGQAVFTGGGSATVPQVLAFETTPGRRDVRISIEAAADGETIDRELFSVEVPDLTSEAISTPRVFRARTVNEFRAASAGGATPSARREFVRSDRLLIRFDAYPAEDAPAPVTAAVVNASGRKLADVRVAPAPAGGTHQIDLILGAFSQGEYVLEITSGDIAEFVPFRIIG